MLVPDPAVGPVHPGLEVGDRAVRSGKELLARRGCALRAAPMVVAVLGQDPVGLQAVRVHDRARLSAARAGAGGARGAGRSCEGGAARAVGRRGCDLLNQYLLHGGSSCEVVGPRGKHDPDRVAVRHGHEAGEVTLGSRRVAVERPRARSADGGDEVPLAAYRHFADRDALSRVVLERMLAGVSTRRFPRTQEPVGEEIERDARSTSKSAVSARGVTQASARPA